MTEQEIYNKGIEDGMSHLPSFMAGKEEAERRAWVDTLSPQALAIYEQGWTNGYSGNIEVKA